MYLEKLEIQGFKSFANKNKLVFSGLLANKKRGITVVVGPNGSGKSNIADSISWALGEQSSKLLRSKKSEDVIFSGSDKKARLNMAEVSLFFNNEDNNILDLKNNSVDLKENQGNEEGDNIDALLMSPEIILTRRVFRDGNSDYFINNNKVRLSDVQIFLAKANFGQKTYSVIGQGMVENFLNTSPAERKVFFDEATGVKQYQIKRDLSLNKLENSQENLSKVEILLNEIEPRLKSLTRQVGKLKKRQFLEEELLKNQLNYYSKIWREISLKLNDFKFNINKDEKTKLKLDEQLENNKRKLSFELRVELINAITKQNDIKAIIEDRIKTYQPKENDFVVFKEKDFVVFEDNLIFVGAEEDKQIVLIMDKLNYSLFHEDKAKSIAKYYQELNPNKTFFAESEIIYLNKVLKQINERIGLISGVIPRT